MRQKMNGLEIELEKTGGEWEATITDEQGREIELSANPTALEATITDSQGNSDTASTR